MVPRAAALSAIDSSRASVAANQALRLRRFRLAAATYALGLAVATAYWALGLLPLAALAQAGAAFLAVNVVLYGVTRSGLNLRFKDPSLTRFQILVAITILMYLIYRMDGNRSVALFGCFIVFLFGILRLSAREFVGITLYTLAAHALVINLLMAWRPHVVQDPRAELMTWIALAVFLPMFVVIGMQVHEMRRRLHASRARFLGLAEMTSDFYWESDTTHRLTERASAGSLPPRVSLFSNGATIGQRRWDIASMSPGEAGWRAHEADMDAHRPFRGFELSRMGVDGTERYISISGDPVFGPGGEFQGYRGVGSDITARKRLERALLDNAETMRIFADSVPAMSSSWDAELCCRFANLPFTEFFRLPADGTVGRHLRDLAGAEVYAEIEPHFAQVMRGLPVTYERAHRQAGEGPRYLEVKLLPQYGAQGSVLGCFEVTTDITEHKLAERRIRLVANHDSLTGLPNKLLFGQRLDEGIALARAEGRRFALLYLDLDRFKPVNDSFGHAAGDELLRDVAQRIQQQVRDTDTVARVGGDEFTVILPGISDRARAEVVARKIASALGVAFELGDPRQSISIGGSVGVALYPADGADAKALLEAADAAMYRAKQLARQA